MWHLFHLRPFHLRPAPISIYGSFNSVCGGDRTAKMFAPSARSKEAALSMILTLNRQIHGDPGVQVDHMDGEKCYV